MSYKQNDPYDLVDKIKQAVEMLLSVRAEKVQINAKRRINKFASLNDSVYHRLELL